jgi:hypothetical protein
MTAPQLLSMATVVVGLLAVGALQAQSPDDRPELYVRCMDEMFSGPDLLPPAAAQKRVVVATQECQREARWRIVSEDAYDRCWRNTGRAAGGGGEKVIHTAKVACAAKYGVPFEE